MHTDTIMPKKTPELEITDKTTFVSAFNSFPPHHSTMENRNSNEIEAIIKHALIVSHFCLKKKKKSS